MVSLIVPVPVKLRLPPCTKNTCSGASILFPFRFILTVLFISNVLFNVLLDVSVIVLLLLAYFIASSRVS